MMRIVLAVCMRGAVLAGCSGPPATEKPQSEAAAAAPAGAVSKTGFVKLGKLWPLSVADGLVGCDATKMAYWFESGGVRYGLNGFATKENGYAPIEPIWLLDEEHMAQMRAAFPDQASKIPTTRLSIGDLIAVAKETCGQ